MIMAWLAGLPLALWRGMGAVLGLGLWLFAWQRRRVVWVNLTLCFTHASRARRSWWSLMVMVHFAQTWLDRVWLWHASPALLAKRLTVHGELGASGAQVYLAPHFMGLDAGWTALTRSQPECRMATIYAPQSMAWLNQWMTRGRGRFGQPTLFTKRGQLREVVRSAVDVGVVIRQVFSLSLDDGKRLLGAGRIVQIDQGLPMHLTLEDGEFLSDALGQGQRGHL